MYNHLPRLRPDFYTQRIRALPADPDWPDSEYPPSIGPSANAGDVAENFNVVQV